MKLQDQSDIYDLIKKYPQQFERGFRLAEPVRLSKNVKEIILCATSYNTPVAEIVADIFGREAHPPYFVHQGYDLPHATSSESLVIAISVCGKRPEVISAAHMAYSQKANLVIVTSGGELENFARERSLPLILIDKANPEFHFRMAGGIMFAIITQILINAGVLSPKTRQQILAAGQNIEKMYLTKQGSKLAEMIADTSVLVYAPNQYSGVAHFLKHLLNIFIPLPSWTNEIPAVRYSEIYSLQRKGLAKYFALILKDPSADARLQDDTKKLQEQFSDDKIKHYILELPGADYLEKSLAALMLFYWTIYALLQKK